MPQVNPWTAGVLAVVVLVEGALLWKLGIGVAPTLGVAMGPLLTALLPQLATKQVTK